MSKTRHSVGMEAVNRLAEHIGGGWIKDKATSSYTAIVQLTEDTQLVLIKSRKYMNLNGISVKRAGKNHDSQSVL